MKTKMTPLYRFAKVVIPVIYAIFSPLVIRRAGPLPEGRMVLCSNHFSLNDPLYLGVAQERQVYYMAKAGCFATASFAGCFAGWAPFR